MLTAAVEAATERRRASTVAVGAAGALWLGAAGWLERNNATASALPVGCPFKALTGLDCPGCGSTRSLGALTQLDIGAAFDQNVFVPFALVFVVASFVVWTNAVWRRPTPDSSRRSAAFAATDLVRRADVIIALGVLLVVFTVVRNLDAGTWLASGLAHTAQGT